jgi:hypothetical protein
MNWYILIPFGIAVIVLVVFLIKHNQKEEEKFEDQLNNDYPKTKEEEGDMDTEELVK